MQDDGRAILTLLDDLILATRHLGRSAEENGEDVTGVAEACREKLSRLRELLPEGALQAPDNGIRLGENAGSRIEEKLAELARETLRSSRALREKRDDIQEKLLALSGSRKAIDAYRKHR